MTVSMHAASIPVFKQFLGTLSLLLDKAEAYAAEKQIDPAVLLQSRLYPDMYPFLRQVQLTCDFAKGTAARIAGAEPPKHPDTEQTFDELRARVAKTLAFLDTLTAAQIDGGEEREITLNIGGAQRTFKAQPYLLHFATPQVMFHLTTAYAILRHNGVPLEKRDFIGKF